MCACVCVPVCVYLCICALHEMHVPVCVSVCQCSWVCVCECVCACECVCVFLELSKLRIYRVSGTVARLVNCLLCKCEDLGLNPQHHMEEAGTAGRVCGPSEKGEAGGLLKLAGQPVQLSCELEVQ